MLKENVLQRFFFRGSVILECLCDIKETSESGTGKGKEDEATHLFVERCISGGVPARVRNHLCFIVPFAALDELEMSELQKAKSEHGKRQLRAALLGKGEFGLVSRREGIEPIAL